MKILLTAIFMLAACSTETIKEVTVYKEQKTETVCTTSVKGPEGVDCTDPECAFQCWWIKECKEIPTKKIDDGISKQ